MNFLLQDVRVQNEEERHEHKQRQVQMQEQSAEVEAEVAMLHEREERIRQLEVCNSKSGVKRCEIPARMDKMFSEKASLVL